MTSEEAVDLENVVQKWAETMFKASKTGSHSRIPKTSLQYKINWDKVHFVHGKQEPVIKAKPSRMPKSQVLFRTVFTNRTDREQEYSFQTSRETTSTCDVSMQRCYTVGSEVNISVQTPAEVLSANAGFHRELSLTKASSTVISETLTWKVDGQIKVDKGQMTTAELVVSEEKLSDQFTITSQIFGKLLVVVTNRQDNNSLLEVFDGDIVEIIKGAQLDGDELASFSCQGDVAEFVSKGSYAFHYAMEQHIDLSQEDVTKKAK